LSGQRFSLFAPRRAAFKGATVAIVTLLTSGLAASTAHGASVDGDRAQIAQIQKQIEEKGAEIEALVGEANQARANLSTLHAEIKRDEVLLAADTRAEQVAAALARQSAVVAYISAGNGSASGLSLLDGTTSVTRVMGGTHYLNLVNTHLDNNITQLEIAKSRTDDDRNQLVKQQDDAQHQLDQLTRAQADANSAITAQNETLTRVQADLTATLVRQKHQREAQARRAAERAIAAALAAAMQKADAAPTVAPSNAPASRDVSTSQTDPSGSGPSAPPPAQPAIAPAPPPAPIAAGGYANPLRAVSGLSPERIDSGVDYAGIGPVYAVGDGVVLNTFAGGWPGGTFIAYQLNDGPARGLVVYVAEDINPQVSVGSTVTANTVIGQMYGGPNGIETGWADPNAIPNAMARSYGQYHGGNSTAFGYNFSRFLQALGAPGGILQNPPTGTLPPGWPQW
jgi:murein DD-endopeptidase MepM/ murein hydrolase activator NlpD